MGIALDMTSLLRIAMVAACDLPPEMQGEITRLILAYPDEPLLTPPGDVDALAGAMRRLREDPALARRLADRARGSAYRFSPDRAAAAMRELYDQVIRAD